MGIIKFRRKWPPYIADIVKYILYKPPTEEMMKMIYWWESHWVEEDLNVR